MIKTTGELIKQYRLEKGLSVAELSAMTGITFSQLHQYEKGTRKPKFERLYKIALALNVPVEYLLFDFTSDDYIGFMNTFGETLKYCRRITGITVVELANRMNIDKSYIYRWEKNEMFPTLKYILKIANALELPAEYLIFGDPEHRDLWLKNRTYAERYKEDYE